jgi:acyl-CoA synthetase (NDP forming)
MIASASPEHFLKATRALLADEHVDSLIVIFIPPLITDPEAVAAAIVEGSKDANGKPVLANFMSAKGAPEILNSIPSYEFPESAASALAKVTTYGEWRRKPMGTVPTFGDIRTDDVKEIAEKALARGGGWLSPSKSVSCLTPQVFRWQSRGGCNESCRCVEGGREDWFRLRSATGPAIIHKTEVGGVLLNLMDETAVRRG